MSEERLARAMRRTPLSGSRDGASGSGRPKSSSPSPNPPEEFSLEPAGGPLNCDRSENSSFSTSGNGRELFR
jgi:hypothetical protein